ncbi:hypothetical protein JTE90_005790 [Oedothorax gibbosus]|uniref:Uncharacterized protein n=1 Tax=Oedothorax gibbosus TaxID=931172 RepID=A0AAV6TD25_9ARAC|nr:hypothetical protein JTE90_005790 [Oedothorax gibbosus]
MSESERISESRLFSKSERVSKYKVRQTDHLSSPVRLKQVVGQRFFFFPPVVGETRRRESGGERRNWFWVGSSCCSAPYIWGTVSVLLGFSWWITVSASLACFPHVSASLRVVRPPCRAAPSRKLFLWEYGAYCDRSIGLRVGVS